MKSLPIYHVDAFTSERSSGNPAGVCLLDHAMPDDWMRSVAAKINFSETAFVLPEGEGYHLRWFTPRVEVDLCGHATLAGAHVLFGRGVGSPILFHTRSGDLTARREGDWIELDFPATPPVEAPLAEGLAFALGLTPVWSGVMGPRVFIEAQSAQELRTLRPDFAALRALPGRSVTVTARSDQVEYDFISRHFAPWVGVEEDPVTGAAHCMLGPYWRERLGRDSLTGYQASARGGVVKVRCAGERVILAGQAVTELEYSICV